MCERDEIGMNHQRTLTLTPHPHGARSPAACQRRSQQIHACAGAADTYSRYRYDLYLCIMLYTYTHMFKHMIHTHTAHGDRIQNLLLPIVPSPSVLPRRQTHTRRRSTIDGNRTRPTTAAHRQKTPPHQPDTTHEIWEIGDNPTEVYRTPEGT